MNTKFFKSLAAVAVAVLTVGCAKEQGSQEGPANVTFEIENPVAVTKAIGDGTTAKKLYYQVFDAAGNPIAGLPVQNKTLSSLKTTVSFQLVKDQKYNFIFWAQTPEDGYYTIDGTEGLKKITADYEGKKSNDENFDAFFAVEKALTINGPITKTVTLKRPFAQINIATTDVLKAGDTKVNVNFTGATSAVTVKGVPTVFSPLTDEFSASVDAQFASAAIPEGNFSVTGSTDTYKYLAVNYVFAPVDGTVYDVEAAFNVDGKDVTVKVPSAPAKRNYRTNIYGNLLTSTADFDVVIDPGFAGEENMEMWDGSADAVTEVDGVYEIKNAAQLAWVSQQVNSGATTFSGKTVKLVDDIYLGGKSWTPIGTVVSVPSVAFYGTFDGNGKTIHDLNASDNTPNYSTAGLFGSLVSATIKDLTIENAVVKSNHYAGVICGYSEGESTIQNCKVSNVSVTSAPELIEAAWDNGDKVGGIAGYIVSAEVTGCTVENAAIQGYRDLGGIVGYANTTSKVTGNALKGTVTITVDKSHNYKNYTSDAQFDANPYVGEKSAEATVSDNTGEASIHYLTAIVSTQEEFDAAIGNAASGETIVLTAPLTLLSPTIVSDKEVNIDLADNTLVLKSGFWTSTNGENADEAGSITFKNGTIECAGTNSLYPAGKSKMELDNVTLTSAEDSPILVQNTATLIVKNSKINAKYYGITTNASNPNQNETIVVDNCEITAGDPILVNIPCNLTVTKSTMNGKWHGTVVRGGTATFTDCKIVLDYVDSDAADVAANYNWMGATWGTGNSITIAALVLGNHAPSAYQYPTNVTLKNTTVACEGVNASLFPSVYSYANQGEGLGVTFNYDAASNLESGKGPVYNSANIVVNGVEI